jgi:hypothetical protein
MFNVKPLTLLFHLVTIKRCPIISDQDFGNSKSINDVLPQEKDDIISGDICQGWHFMKIHFFFLIFFLCFWIVLMSKIIFLK